MTNSLREGKGSQQRDKDSGKRVRGESDDSFLYLDAPEKAVVRPTVTVLLEQGTPTVSLEIEGELRRLIIDTFLTYPYFKLVCRGVTSASLL